MEGWRPNDASHSNTTGDKSTLMNCPGSNGIFEVYLWTSRPNQITRKTTRPTIAAPLNSFYPVSQYATVCDCASVCLIIRRKLDNKWFWVHRACTNLSPKSTTGIDLADEKSQDVVIGRHAAQRSQFDKLVLVRDGEVRPGDTWLESNVPNEP